MLVMTRRIGEWIIIGDNLIGIKVVNIDNNQVRLGIQAPDAIAVNREEIYEKLKLEGYFETPPKPF